MRLLASPSHPLGFPTVCLRHFGVRGTPKKSLFLSTRKTQPRPAAIASVLPPRREVQSYNFHEQLPQIPPLPPLEDAFIRFRKIAHELSDQSVKKPRRKVLQTQLGELRASLEMNGPELLETLDFPFLRRPSPVQEVLAARDRTRAETQAPSEGQLAVLQRVAGTSLQWFCQALSERAEKSKNRQNLQNLQNLRNWDPKELEVLSGQFAKALRHRQAFFESMQIKLRVEAALEKTRWRVSRSDLLVLAVSPHSLSKGDFREGYLVSQESLEGEPVTVVKQRRMPEGSQVTIVSLHQLVSEPVAVRVTLAGVGPKPWERTLAAERPVQVELRTVLAQMDYLKFRKTQDFLVRLQKGLGEFEDRTRLADIDDWLGTRAKLTGAPTPR